MPGLDASLHLGNLVHRASAGSEGKWMPTTSSEPRLAKMIADQLRELVEEGLATVGEDGGEGFAVSMEFAQSKEDAAAPAGLDVMHHGLGIVARELADLGYHDMKLQVVQPTESGRADPGERHRIAIAVPIPAPDEVDGYQSRPVIDVRSSEQLSNKWRHKNSDTKEDGAAYLFRHNLVGGAGDDVGWTREYEHLHGTFSLNIPERNQAFKRAKGALEAKFDEGPGILSNKSYQRMVVVQDAWRKFLGENTVAW